MSAVSKTTALIAVLGFIALFGSFGYLTLKQVEQVKTKIVTNQNQLAEVYVAEPSYAEDNVYDAVFCPNAEVAKTKQCNYVGGKAFQDLLNNLPATTPEKPFKIFLREGIYTAFIPEKYVESNEYEAKIAFISSKNLELVGESKSATVIDLLGQRGEIYLENSLFKAKNITFAGFTPNYSLTSFSNNQIPNILNLHSSVFKTINSELSLKDVSVLDSSLLIARGKSITNLNSVFISESGNRPIVLEDTSSLVAFGLVINSRLPYDFSVNNKLSVSTGDFSSATFYNSVFNLSNEEDTQSGPWFTSGGNSKIKIYNSYIHGSSVNNYECLGAYYGSIEVVNSIITNCNRVMLAEGSPSIILISKSFIYDYGEREVADPGLIKYLNPPTNSDYFVNPQIPFNINNLNDPTNFVLPTGNIAINAGDSTIKDIDGSVSDIGVLGGPNVCAYKPDFTGCPTVNTTTVEPVLRTGSVTPGVTPIATVNPTPIVSVLPSPINIDADVNNDGTINLTDVILVVQAVFN